MAASITFSCRLAEQGAASAHQRFSYDIRILTSALCPGPYNLLALSLINILLLITILHLSS